MPLATLETRLPVIDSSYDASIAAAAASALREAIIQRDTRRLGEITTQHAGTVLTAVTSIDGHASVELSPSFSLYEGSGPFPYVGLPVHNPGDGSGRTHVLFGVNPDGRQAFQLFPAQ